MVCKEKNNDGQKIRQPAGKRQKDLADIFRIIEQFPQLETYLPQSIREELNK